MEGKPEPNDALRRLMDEHGLTFESLAEAVNDALLELTGERGCCDPRQVHRWRRGHVRWPHPPNRHALEKVFGIPAQVLGFRPTTSQAARATVEATDPTPRQETPVHRRNFIVGLTGGLLALPALPDSGRLGMSDVNHVRSVTARLDKLDDRHGGEQLTKVASQYVQHVEHAAQRCVYGSNVRSHLYSALGELAANTGWFAFDSNQQDVARRWYDTGLRYAVLAGDKMLQTQVWSCMSFQAFALGDGGEAVAIAQAALDRTKGRRDGQLSALLHTRVAHGHAVQGEATLCGRSLHRAETAYDREPPQPQRWLSFFTPGELAAEKSSCFLDLGKPHKAVGLAREALRVVRSTPFRRNEYAAHIRLGHTLATAGELDAAVAAGNNALSLRSGICSPRIDNRLKQLRDVLVDRKPAGSTEFAERYETVVA